MLQMVCTQWKRVDLCLVNFAGLEKSLTFSQINRDYFALDAILQVFL